MSVVRHNTILLLREPGPLVSRLILPLLFLTLLHPLYQEAQGHSAGPTAFGVSTWLSCFSIMVLAQVAWAPYVADYSRYLPSGTSSRQAFWHTYVGSVAGAAIFASIGAMASTVVLGTATLRTAALSPTGYLATLLPGAGWLAVIVPLLGTVAADLYRSNTALPCRGRAIKGGHRRHGMVR